VEDLVSQAPASRLSKRDQDGRNRVQSPQSEPKPKKLGEPTEEQKEPGMAYVPLSCCRSAGVDHGVDVTL
jgi:hypothetical protein